MISYDFKEIQIFTNKAETGGITIIYNENYMDYFLKRDGGNIGSISLDNEKGFNIEGTKALVFVGGSTLGLEAVTGVNAKLLEFNRLNKLPFFDRALGVCLYTIKLQDRIEKFETNLGYPNFQLGFDTLFNKKNVCEIPIGQEGAGYCSTIGKVFPDYKESMVDGAQIAWFEECNKTGIKVLLVMVLNSIGVISSQNGKILHDFVYKGKKYYDASVFDDILCQKHSPNKNTTLTCLITNVKLSEDLMRHYTDKISKFLKKFIHPYGTYLDGDVVFILSTKQISNYDPKYVWDLFSKSIEKGIENYFL
jgi:L-aminopeptidase/D-esterase-like protein